MKVGFIYISPIGEGGWSYAHDQARKFLSSLPGVTTSYVESVPEGQDAERIIQNMARKHYDIIFATSFGFTWIPCSTSPNSSPNSTFMHCSGYKTAPNMSNYFGRIYQARYLTGLVAGSMTKQRHRLRGGLPLPEVIRGINAFTLGACAP